jgi:hypothetical protein
MTLMLDSLDRINRGLATLLIRPIKERAGIWDNDIWIDAYVQGKREMNKLLFLLFIAIFGGCSSFGGHSSFRGYAGDPAYIRTVDRVVGKELKKICREEDLDVFGYGGAMANTISEISPQFCSKREVSLSEGRELIVKIIEQIKDAVNNTESLAPYLTPYPFPGSGVSAGILFLDERNEIREHGCVYIGTGGVSYISQIEGSLYYSSHNPRTERFERYHAESYEEALAIVRGECAAPEIEAAAE